MNLCPVNFRPHTLKTDSPATCHVAVGGHDVVAVHVDVQAVGLSLVDGQPHTVGGGRVEQEESHALGYCAAQVQVHPAV